MQDYFSSLFDAINKLLDQNSGMFEQMGMNIFRGLAITMLSWFGIQSALAGNGVNWAKFVALVQELTICYAMLAFYTVPIPGFGISFTHLILDQVQYMVGTLDQGTIQRLLESLNDLESNLPAPSPLAILEIVRFVVLVLAILAAQAATLVVVMYGYTATAVILLLGPVFIPFKILPQMEFMFWGWFRSLLQYACYQLVATSYVFVFGQFLMRILGAQVSGPLSNTQLAVLFLPCLLTVVTFALGTLKVPALTHAIFSGHAGDTIT